MWAFVLRSQDSNLGAELLGVSFLDRDGSNPSPAACTEKTGFMPVFSVRKWIGAGQEKVVDSL